MKIAIDGSVFVAAAGNPLARTGVYFVTIYLCRALAARNDIELSILVNESHKNNVVAILSDQGIDQYINNQSFRFGHEPICLVLPFFPASKEIYEIEQLKVVQVVHDLAYHACKSLSLDESKKEFEKQLVASVQRDGLVVCVSETTRRDLCSIFYFPAERVGIFYPGVRPDVQEYTRDEFGISALKTKFGIPLKAQYLVVLSTLEPRKNLKTSLICFERLVCQNPDIDLYLVIAGLKGWGNELEALNTFPISVTKKIRIIGYQPDQNLPHLLAGATCMLFPSLYEGFGLPPVEALWCGTPVIASNCGSLPEILGDGVAITDPFDVDTISQYALAYYRDHSYRAEIVKKGQNFVKKYTWKNGAAMLVDFLGNY